jgi:hypothetical protein
VYHFEIKREEPELIIYLEEEGRKRDGEMEMGGRWKRDGRDERWRDERWRDERWRDER